MPTKQPPLSGTKNDLLALYVKGAGAPYREVRHRIRVLSEDGLLPQRAQILSWRDLAIALIGFGVGGQHIDAPASVRRVSAFRCNTVVGECDGKPPLMDQPLLEAVTASLRAPYELYSLEVSTTHNFASLKVGDASRQGRILDYYYSGKGLDLAPTTFPIVTINRITKDLVDYLVSEMSADRQTSNEPDRKTKNAVPARTAFRVDQSGVYTQWASHTDRSDSYDSDPTVRDVAISTRKTDTVTEFRSCLNLLSA